MIGLLHGVDRIHQVAIAGQVLRAVVIVLHGAPQVIPAHLRVRHCLESSCVHHSVVSLASLLVVRQLGRLLILAYQLRRVHERACAALIEALSEIAVCSWQRIKAIRDVYVLRGTNALRQHTFLAPIAR